MGETIKINAVESSMLSAIGESGGNKRKTIMIASSAKNIDKTRMVSARLGEIFSSLPVNV
jgi:hypothetical protein